VKREPTLSRCCSQIAYMEPISLIEVSKRTTFAKVPVCSSCSRILGDPKPVYGCPIRPLEAKSWGTSWALMGELRRERIGTALYFVKKDGMLVPEATADKVAVQKDLPDEEIPF
jgi:hypothetical protein